MNFKHLHYFWAAAKAGGIVRAGEQLHISPQTLSGQIKLLEERLGCALFRKVGRGLELTDEGRVALGYAEQIFALGTELESKIGQVGDSERGLDFQVGIADSVPKAIAYRLLEPALAVSAQLRLLCHEGKFQDLLGRLAVHRLDLVIADEPMGRQVSVKAYNHLLGTTEMSFFAAPALKRSLVGEFPQCLDGAPMLLPGSSSAIRQRFDFWLASHAIRPRTIAVIGASPNRQTLGNVALDNLANWKFAGTVIPVHGQATEQVLELAFMADQPHRLGHRQAGLQQAAGERLGHRVGNADAKVERLRRALGAAQAGFEFAAEGEDLVGIGQRDAAVVGQLELAAALAEELAAEALLEQLDLARQCLWRGVQLLAGAHDAARLRGDPEVVQVLEVHGGDGRLSDDAVFAK